MNFIWAPLTYNLMHSIEVTQRKALRIVLKKTGIAVKVNFITSKFYQFQQTFYIRGLFKNRIRKHFFEIYCNANNINI